MSLPLYRLRFTNQWGTSRQFRLRQPGMGGAFCFFTETFNSTGHPSSLSYSAAVVNVRGDIPWFCHSVLSGVSLSPPSSPVRSCLTLFNTQLLCSSRTYMLIDAFLFCVMPSLPFCSQCHLKGWRELFAVCVQPVFFQSRDWHLHYHKEGKASGQFELEVMWQCLTP